MAVLNGGRAVVQLLKAEGVKYIFGIVGSTFLDVLDALYDDRGIEYINVRHEQAAAFMMRDVVPGRGGQPDGRHDDQREHEGPDDKPPQTH